MYILHLTHWHLNRGIVSCNISVANPRIWCKRKFVLPYNFLGFGRTIQCQRYWFITWEKARKRVRYKVPTVSRLIVSLILDRCFTKLLKSVQAPAPAPPFHSRFHQVVTTQLRLSGWSGKVLWLSYVLEAIEEITIHLLAVLAAYFMNESYPDTLTLHPQTKRLKWSESSLFPRVFYALNGGWSLWQCTVQLQR